MAHKTGFRIKGYWDRRSPMLTCLGAVAFGLTLLALCLGLLAVPSHAGVDGHNGAASVDGNSMSIATSQTVALPTSAAANSASAVAEQMAPAASTIELDSLIMKPYIRTAEPVTPSLDLAWLAPQGSDWTDQAWGDWDDDGDLDLAAVSYRQPVQVYANDGGDLYLVWSAPTAAEDTRGIAWGDWDNDGDLDLAVGNYYEPNQVYTNLGGMLELAWTSAEIDDPTSDVAWGDWDNDGDLDLAVGNGMPSGFTDRVYENTGGNLVLAWTSNEYDSTTSVAWGDWDGDGDLDLAVGNANMPTGEANKVYENTGGNLELVWTEPLQEPTFAVAWADWDLDGDLDLAFANSALYGSAPNRVYSNIGGDLALAWSSSEINNGSGLSWGDWDGDGDLDLAVGGAHSRVYTNRSGSLVLAWSSDEAGMGHVDWGDWDGDGDLDLAAPGRIYANSGGDLELNEMPLDYAGTRSVDWGDWDGDGDPDLAVAKSGSPTQIYENIGGSFALAWLASESSGGSSVAWGDWDGDGDLDLAVGGTPNRVYRNIGRDFTLAWSSPEQDGTLSVAWGDWDGDSDLDLAVGNARYPNGAPNRVYENDHGELTLAWSSAESDYTTSVAWGDWDNDGDLDLAAGNATIGYFRQPDRVYRNIGSDLVLAWSSVGGVDSTDIDWGDWDNDGDLDLVSAGDEIVIYANSGGNLNPAWFLDDSSVTSSIDWGDWDGDGDLDLAVGNLWTRQGAEPNRVYTNDGGSLSLSWQSSIIEDTTSVAWADWDNDGDLDLVVGNWGRGYLGTSSSGFKPTRLYENNGGALHPVWSTPYADDTYSVAWADWDGDGDMDLAAGNYGQNSHVFTSNGPDLRLAWSTPWYENTTCVAWGDWDGDKDLDLAVANDGQPNRVYRNVGARMQLAWSSTELDNTYSLAWGDWDGDGDLDLAVGNVGQPNRVYENDGGDLRPVWSSVEAEDTHSVAWGDWDGDGDLDLAIGNNGQPNHVFSNNNHNLTLAWSSPEIANTSGVAWGDMEGDGDLDLAVSNIGQPNRVYENTGVTLQLAWSAPQALSSCCVAWGDWESDGDQDLVIGNPSWFTFVYVNRSGEFPVTWLSPDWVHQTSSLAWGDWDGDDDLDLALGTRFDPSEISASRVYENLDDGILGFPDNSTIGKLSYPGGPKAYFFSSALVQSGPILPIHYTLRDREGNQVRFVKAYYSLDSGSTWQPAVAAGTTITRNLAASPEGVEHIFNWDVYASGVFGSSDSTVFRLDVYQGFTGPGPYQYAFRSARTLPFRLRGSQVRVMQDGAPTQGAMVYYLRAGQSGEYEPYVDRFGHPFHTNPVGYLQGFGEIGLGDRLVALAPITATESYTLYYTSASATSSGLDPYTVSALGVQTLTVSAQNPLVLFNLGMSLEWDARNDPVFMAQLNQDIRRASELLYDWSNGQAALGKVTVYHAKKHWQDAHVLIYANNRFRPAATEGGIISDVVSETVSIGATSVITYLPGQVAMGPEWNRYGDPGSNLGEDWPRAFAHELAHYALFLDDNYVGLDDAGLLMPVDTCPGAMADPYRDDAASGYGEFHPAANWLPRCQDTLSNRNTGRADWTTVGRFYPWLNTTIDNPGPSVLPLSVTEVQVVEPITPTTTLPAPLFLLVQDGNRVLPDARARSYLFQDGWAIDLGQPSQDRLLARGAKPGDRLCVYDLGASRLGCETITAGDTELVLMARPNWQPEVTITPVTSVTLVISMSNVVANPPIPALKAKLYPLGEPSQGDIALTQVGDDYVGVFELDEPSLVGTIRVWVDEAEPRREVVSDYVLGGNPARIWSGGARIWSGGARIWSGGARIWSGGAPVASADGQVVLYSPDHSYGPEWFLTVQVSSAAPPPWATLVGKAYRVAASGAAPDLTEMSIAFSYLGSDVPPGEEPWLRVYHWDGTDWTQLPTRLDTTNNMASARVIGSGVYALLSSIEVPLYDGGWNMFGYPILETRPVTEALISITGYYTTVHGYDTTLTDPFERWRTHDLAFPRPLTTLDVLEFGRGYWINVTQPVVIRFKGAVQALETSPELQLPPATYFGPVAAGMGLTPTVGMPVTAWIDGHLCGRGLVQDVDGQPMVAINVLSNGSGVAAGCGMTGWPVGFRVDGMAVTPGVLWDHSQTRQLTFQRCPDFDASGAVDVGDVIATAERWGQQRGVPGWQEQYDWDGDSDVDIVDIQRVTAVWGQVCPAWNP